MWTRILEGKEGLGEDFDFVYFVAPKDFARYFALDGDTDMLKIENYFDKRLGTDPELRQAVDKGLTRSAFRNYYALKASTTFSKGAHDEWNIVRALNERRRAHDRFGIANQLAVLFDGAGVAPSSSEGATSDGYAGKCSN
jgi:alpha-mannosidase